MSALERSRSGWTQPVSNQTSDMRHLEDFWGSSMEAHHLWGRILAPFKEWTCWSSELRSLIFKYLVRNTFSWWISLALFDWACCLIHQGQIHTMRLQHIKDMNSGTIRRYQNWTSISIKVRLHKSSWFYSCDYSCLNHKNTNSLLITYLPNSQFSTKISERF